MLSRRSIDMLLDLIENRVACMQVIDREDHRQLTILTQARREILSMSAVVKREDRGKSRVAAAEATSSAALASAVMVKSPMPPPVPVQVPVVASPSLETVAAA